MKIDQVSVYLARFPLKKSFRMGTQMISHFDSVLVRMQSGGVSGWGEVFPGNEPSLTAAWSAAAFDCICNSLLPRLSSSLHIDSAEQLSAHLKEIKGNRDAKGAIELAWWDLHAKLKNEPLHKTIGGDATKEIELGLTFDQEDSPDAFLESVQRSVDEGFRRVSLKMRPGWDLQVVGAVRNQHPTLSIQCDLEGELSFDRHSELIYRFDDFMISLLEQPLSPYEYVGHAMLADSIRTTIGLDESITMLHQAEIAADLRSAGTFCLKPGKMGGLHEAKAIYELAKNAEIDCYVGADIMTSIGYRFVAALASLPAIKRPTDYFRFDEMLQCDPGEILVPQLKAAPLSAPKIESMEEYEANRRDIHDGQSNDFSAEKIIPHTGKNILDGEKRLVLALWDAPGIGFDPNIDMIEKHSLRKI
ncbi:MAG: enolase C-terminal domain-like protein [Thermoguttaceae bacterium]